MDVDFSTRDPRICFPVTRRSVVAAFASENPAERAASFDVLVRAYWRPVYKHVRLRHGRPEEDARDLTQGFFARVLEKQYLSDYEPGRALFRTYLRTCLDRFVMEEARARRRQKRGGAATRLSLEFDVAEGELQSAVATDAEGLESCFDAEWTRDVLAHAVENLEKVCAAKGKQLHFDLFRRYVLEPASSPTTTATPSRPTYASLASELGLSLTDVTNHLAWVRREFRRVLLDELRARTVSDVDFRAESLALLGFEP